tara:strand:+ start:22 stop:657 length:636 start_codon:yes stop_codon:yes gene_type:complete
MSEPKFDQLDIKNEFEFNDGIGDVLKEKESYTFSWKKTAIVMGAITSSILVLTFVLLEVGKKALELNKTALETAVESNEMIDRLVTEEAAWDVLPEIIEEEMITQPDKIIESKIDSEPVVTIKKASKPIENTYQTKAKSYRVIAGSFSKFSNAKKRVSDLERLGVPSFIWEEKTSNGIIFKLQVGAFKSYSSASQHVKDLKSKNIDSYILN